MSSFKPEVRTNSDAWSGNACRFATEEAAQLYVNNLSLRWWSVTDTRVVPSDDPVNYRWDDNKGAVSLAADMAATGPVYDLSSEELEQLGHREPGRWSDL